MYGKAPYGARCSAYDEALGPDPGYGALRVPAGVPRPGRSRSRGVAGAAKGAAPAGDGALRTRRCPARRAGSGQMPCQSGLWA